MKDLTKTKWSFKSTISNVSGDLKSEIGETVRAIRLPKLYPCSPLYYRLKLQALLK